MPTTSYREIPYNYTSANDRQIVCQVLGTEVWQTLEQLRSQRVTGRSARLLTRFIGDLFILKRNPFVYEELIESHRRRKEFFQNARLDLTAVEDAAMHGEVQNIVETCRAKLHRLEHNLKGIRRKRKQVRKALGAIIGPENVYFDPFTINSHATDATDWRLCLPFAVVRPDQEEQVPKLLAAISKLGYGAIPRGAGTGLTGGAVPVRENCILVNTEKLNHILGITDHTFTDDAGTPSRMPVMHLEAGVITDAAMKHAKKSGLVFATDPTSAWACTIGGNIAENAGGKTAVLWGTAIDNLLSFKIAMADGRFLEVRRPNHPMHKIRHEDTVTYEITDLDNGKKEVIHLAGSDIRKPGLWKDITNKTLGGVPGIQKEGCDGVITSAEFILYTAYPLKATSCLEFFGDNMEEASRVIVAMSEAFVNEGEEALMALEHFDDEYIKAINYKVKAPRSEIPKAVLLVDMVAHTKEQLARGKETLATLLAPYANTEVFFARDGAEAERYWADRKRFGAIAARTNAFKLNEDIVLPLAKLAEFARFADDYNTEENRYNQMAAVNAARTYLQTARPAEDPEWLAPKIPTAETLCEEALSILATATREELDAETQLTELLEDFGELFTGYRKILAGIQATLEEVKARRIIIATHMHAGDGNIHVNVPVFSNDLEMMNRANKTADDVMEKAVELDGVVSGEHGIGITKMKYFDKSQLKTFSAYRNRVDPKGVMNPGKLCDPFVPDKVFTPSFNLLNLEAKILQHGSLKQLADKISKCVRCGKCKVDCCTFFPKENLFFHPRNKNLAIAALIEAILYDAQRTHTGRFKALRHMEEIADHCTICHKCKKPCPVDIDTGEVSILEREILSNLKYKHKKLPTRVVLGYLKSTNAVGNTLFRKGVLRFGAEAQRMGARTLASLRRKKPLSVGRITLDPMNAKWVNALQPVRLMESPMPQLPKGTLRDVLPECGTNQALVMEPSGEPVKTVFYFPGCGSERLFSDISKASVYVLLKAGIRVVLPPPYLCCGFPAKVNGETLQHESITLRNTIVFNQIREMLRYLTFDAVVISCGTCLESVEEMGASAIFDAPITDISKFAIENGLDVALDGNRLYHAPCHDSLAGEGMRILTDLGATATSTPHCCSEAGTMALSRTDITNKMRKRKSEALASATSDVDSPEPLVLLTNCPSCIQGLGRNADLPVRPRHLAEELASLAGGTRWEAELEGLLANTEIVNI